jgi:uncharacterized protein (TIGR02145 family)/uncharacterized repeat protein (TIGR02543 family)
MKKGAIQLIFCSVLTTIISLFLFCIGFDSLSSPDKTNISVVFMASNLKTCENALVDSVGKEVRIGAALYLPANFDSVEIQIIDNGKTLIDTIFRTFRSEYFKDTVWVPHTFLKPGVKNVTVTPFANPERPSTGATITIHGVEQFSEDTTPHILFTVTYKGNGNSAGAAPVDTNKYMSSALVTVRGNTGSLVKQGATFIGWNTMADGSGIAYAGGDSFTMSDIDVVLYAQWTTDATFTVSYNGNGNSSGSVPVDPNKYTAAASVTVRENSGLMVKNGYTFTGWNTAADGSGTFYPAGAKFTTGTSDVILYAQYAISRFTVTFNSMEGSAVTSQLVDHGGIVTEPAAPVRTGYTFGGWYEEKTYTTRWNFTAGTITANDTLFAKWDAGSCTVTFDGQNVVANSTLQITFPRTTIDTLPSPTASGYQFGGWFTSINGGGSPFLTTTAVSSDVTVYAKWTRVYKVTYDANGGTGTVPVDSNTYQNTNTVMVLSGSGLSKTDYTFAGWNTQADTLGTSFSSGGSFSMGSTDVVLYAKWRMNAPVIQTQPTSTTCPVNDSITFSVTATGEQLSYQWHKNGSPVDGATAARYTPPALTVSDIGNSATYLCVVSNAGGSVTSNNATLGVATLTDIDGNVYHKVKLGTQVWTVENLKTTRYNDGMRITKDTSAVDWATVFTSVDSGKYCWYNNDSTTNKNLYGALYNWYTVNTGKLAPAGWHVPTDEDWTILEYFLIANGYNWDGTTSGNKIGKSLAAKKDWNSSTNAGEVGNDLNSNNRTGFSALPSGFRRFVGTFVNNNYGANWWSATGYEDSVAFHRYINSSSAELGRYDLNKSCGFSVRLVRD